MFLTICFEQLARKISSENRVENAILKNLLSDLERSLVERFGFGILAHCQVQLGQVIEVTRPLERGLSSLFAVDSSRLGAKKRIVSDINFYSYRCCPSWRDTELKRRRITISSALARERLIA
jgi:hypothetical protein